MQCKKFSGRIKRAVFQLLWLIGYIQYLHLRIEYCKPYRRMPHLKEEYWLDSCLYFLTTFHNCHLGCSEELIVQLQTWGIRALQ